MFRCAVLSLNCWVSGSCASYPMSRCMHADGAMMFAGPAVPEALLWIACKSHLRFLLPQTLSR